MVFELGICDFLERQLSEKDAEKCALWAFGEHFKELDGLINFMKAFNSLHSKLLKLDPCGNLFEKNAHQMLFQHHRDIRSKFP